MLLKGIQQICTECNERCTISSQDPSCSKWKDRLWLDRGSILCRFCKDITQCAQCAKAIDHTGYGMQEDKNISAKLYMEYMNRKRDRV
jgi:hypothetical protein